MKLYEFDPVIYPCKVWVSVDKSPKDVSTIFDDCDGNPIENLVENTASFEAFAMTVHHKETKEWGVIIHFHNTKSMTFDLVTHESCHAAKYVCERMGIDCSVHEPLEFIAGWIAGCCEKVKRNKTIEKVYEKLKED